MPLWSAFMNLENTENLSTQDRVNQICNELYQKGTKPSVRLVLAELPDVSSTSTVHKYFSNWKREMEANQQSLYDRLGFSPDFTKSFMKEISRFAVEAEQRYKGMADDANEQREQAVSDLAKAEDKLHKQTAVVEQQEKQISDLKSELSDTIKQSEANLAQEQKANEATVNELRQQLTTALDENKQLTNQNESLRTELAKAELKLESNQELVEQVKGQNEQLVSDLKEVNAIVADMSKDIASKESTITGNEKLITNLHAQHDKASTQVDSLSKQTIKLQSELDSIKDKLSEQTSLNSKLKSEYDDKVRGLEKEIKTNEKLIVQLEKNQQK